MISLILILGGLTNLAILAYACSIDLGPRVMPPPRRKVKR